MSPLQREALKLDPVPVSKPWGGEKLLPYLLPGAESVLPLGELWLVSTVGDHCRHSRINSGVHDGLLLSDLIKASPEKILGPSWGGEDAESEFPLLFKFLDANTELSVQVHPDDAFSKCRGLGSTGKEESWIILDANPEAFVRVGFSANWDMEKLSEAATKGECVEEALNKVPVKRGDILHIPPRTVHSIGAGIVLAEIQQPSDVTFRIHDGNNVGLDGNPRELHLEMALQLDPPEQDSTDVIPVNPESQGGWQLRIAASPYQVFELKGPWEGQLDIPEDRSSILCLLSGSAESRGERLHEGSVRLLLPGKGEFHLKSASDSWAILCIPT